MLQIIVFVLLVAMSVAGCSSEYDLCVEREKQSYRERNPGASYGQVQAKQAEFEMLCSSYKPR